MHAFLLHTTPFLSPPPPAHAPHPPPRLHGALPSNPPRPRSPRPPNPPPTPLFDCPILASYPHCLVFVSCCASSRHGNALPFPQRGTTSISYHVKTATPTTVIYIPSSACDILCTLLVKDTTSLWPIEEFACETKHNNARLKQQ